MGRGRGCPLRPLQPNYEAILSCVAATMRRFSFFRLKLDQGGRTLGAMQTSVPLIVFSDLDGTLLDHDSYDWGPAKDALALLEKLGAPLVLASSKTAAEMRVLQEQMGLAAYPAIVENGSGRIGPGATTQTKTDQYAALRDVIDSAPEDVRDLFCGFGDMTTADVMRSTGLSEAAAQRARKRAFSEPGIWSGTPAQQSDFVSYLRQQGVSARAGGRFLTLSFGATKADQMRAVTDQFAPVWTIAIGDAPNDIEMIEAADFGVIVHNPHHPPLPLLKGEETGRIIRTSQAGPMGWNTAVLSLIDRLGL